MRGATTLLPHMSEISFAIQKRIEFGRLGELDLVDPAGALGVFIDELGLADQRLVYARADYAEKPDDGKLIEFAINGMLAGLDPHSSYMDSKSLHEMQVEIHGEFGGVGIEVTMEEGLIKVVAPIDET